MSEMIFVTNYMYMNSSGFVKFQPHVLLHCMHVNNFKFINPIIYGIVSIKYNPSLVDQLNQYFNGNKYVILLKKFNYKIFLVNSWEKGWIKCKIFKSIMIK